MFCEYVPEKYSLSELRSQTVQLAEYISYLSSDTLEYPQELREEIRQFLQKVIECKKHTIKTKQNRINEYKEPFNIQ